MKQVVIHVGYHKTGSTFLQRKLFPHLAADFQVFSGPDERYLRMLRGTLEMDAAEIRSYVDERFDPGQVALLSQEGLCGRPAADRGSSPLEIASRLKEVFPCGKVILVVRNQFEYMSSLYTFRVASKGVISSSFDSYLNSNGPAGLFQHLEYDRLVAHYQNLFGQDNVLVLPMEMLKQDPTRMAERICRFMDVPLFVPEDSDPVNASSKSVFVLNMWRPLNFLFKHLLRGLIFVCGRGDDPRRLESFRYGYFNFKKRISMRL